MTKHFTIFLNVNKGDTMNALHSVEMVLDDMGVEYRAVESGNNNPNDIQRLNALLPDTNALIVLGGDGTMLKVSKSCALFDVPVLGLNLGNIGFLTAAESVDIANSVRRLVKGDYEMDERHLYVCQYADKMYLFLNEIVVARAHNKLVPTSVYIDGELYNKFFADGVLVSSPTGSTAYSMSSGGPILSPRLRGLVINGICNHSVFNKAVVIGDDEQVELIPEKDGAELMVDGDIVASVIKNTAVIIKKSSYSLKFVRLAKHDFYGRIKKKLLRWE